MNIDMLLEQMDIALTSFKFYPNTNTFHKVIQTIDEIGLTCDQYLQQAEEEERKDYPAFPKKRYIPIVKEGF